MKFPCAKICQLSGFSKVLVSCLEWQQEFPLTVIPWDLFCWKISSFYILAINTPLWLKIEAARINLGDTGQRPGIWGCSHRLKCLVDRIQGFSPAGWQCNSGLLSDRAACEVLDAWCQAIFPFRLPFCLAFQRSTASGRFCGRIPWTEEPGRVQSMGSQIFLFSPETLKLKRNLSLTVTISHLPGP